MSKIRATDTKPEVMVRKALHARGYRYRKNVRTLPGTPDIVLAKYRTCIFVNGCFWHGHNGCGKYTVPKSNTDFWQDKVRRNKERDAIATARLESIGWSVITVWECELRKKTFDTTLAAIEKQLHLNQQTWAQYRERRRTDRAFAATVARARREVQAEMEAELNIPKRITRLSRELEE